MNSKIKDFIESKGSATFIFSGIIERTKNSFARNFFTITKISYLLKAFASYFLKPKFSKLYFSKNKEIQIISIGIHKLDEFKKQYLNQNILILGGFNEFKYCLKHKINFIDISEIYRNVAFSNWNYKNYSIANKLDRLGHKIIPDELNNFILFANNDLLPFYRAIIYILRKKQCDLIIYQHGYYNYKSIVGQIEGEFADINYILDEIQKKKLSKTNRFAHSKMIVKKNHNIFNRTKKISNSRIVIIGEGWHTQDRILFFKYINYVITIVRKLSKSSTIQYIYRPHPTEKIITRIIPIRTDRLKLEESLNKYDIFVGFSSSLLKEAKDYGCISIQIRDSKWDYFENFQEIGYANFTTNIKGLTPLLDNILQKY
jgi:hypothetical protein